MVQPCSKEAQEAQEEKYQRNLRNLLYPEEPKKNISKYLKHHEGGKEEQRENK